MPTRLNWFSFSQHPAPLQKNEDQRLAMFIPENLGWTLASYSMIASYIYTMKWAVNFENENFPKLTGLGFFVNSEFRDGALLHLVFMESGDVIKAVVCIMKEQVWI
jgi:hypothetical protein